MSGSRDIASGRIASCHGPPKALTFGVEHHVMYLYGCTCHVLLLIRAVLCLRLIIECMNLWISSKTRGKILIHLTNALICFVCIPIFEYEGLRTVPRCGLI